MGPAELRALAAQLLELADDLEAAGQVPPPRPAPPAAARTWTGVMASPDFWRLHGERLGVPVGRAARRAAEARQAPPVPPERPRYADPVPDAAPLGQLTLLPPPRHPAR